jgi:hypothetical protein
VSRFCWWLADLVSRTLEPDEREAVRGDLAESGETGGRAFLDVLGLALRRQSALWMNWPPWVILAGLVLPLGVLLCLISRRDADGSAISLWLYLSNWDPAYLGNPAFCRELAQHAGAILTGYFTLFCWSWSSGFLLGSMSRRRLPFHGILFSLFVLFGALLGTPPRHLGHALFYRARDFPNNAAVFDLPFYRIVFPLILQFTLVIGPSVWGMCHAERVASGRPLFRTLLWTAAIATLPAIAIQTGLASVPNIEGSISRSIARVVAYWPAAYLVAAGIALHRHRRGHSSLAEGNNT